MNKIKMLVAAIATIFSCNAFSQSAKVTASDLRVAPNDTAELVLNLTSTEKASGGQLFLTLPQGIDLVTNEDGDYDFAKGAIVQRKSDISFKAVDNGYQILIYNLSKQEFKQESGSLLTLKLKIGNLEDGPVTGAKLSNIKFTSLAARYINGSKANGTLDDVTLNITVDKTLTGINGVTVDDLQNAEVYNLQGQKVSKVQQGGIYIVNGKKVIVKK